MIALIQRVNWAKVSIERKVHSKITRGYLIFLGVETEDTFNDMEYLSKKVINLRLFADKDQKINLSIKDINGEILVVSQFTLMADTSKGNRPSFIKAAKPEIANALYLEFCKSIEHHIPARVKTGVFGADMQVALENDGPVTIILNSKK